MISASKSDESSTEALDPRAIPASEMGLSNFHQFSTTAHMQHNPWGNAGMHQFLLLLHMQNQNHPSILQQKIPGSNYPHITALNGTILHSILLTPIHNLFWSLYKKFITKTFLLKVLGKKKTHVLPLKNPKIYKKTKVTKWINKGLISITIYWRSTYKI